MNKGYPTIKIAEEIWLSGINYRWKNDADLRKEEYIFHSKGVAEAARKIADKTMYLNSEKAYVLGLLHDYGKKVDEKIEGNFHGKVGYDELNMMGYPEAAKICLTHSFPKKEFCDEEYTSFKKEWIEWAHCELDKIEYDDYDRLIQLCDMLFEGTRIVSYEERFSCLEKRYKLTPQQTDNARKLAKINKDYFDGLCGIDIYDLIGLNKKTN